MSLFIFWFLLSHISGYPTGCKEYNSSNICILCEDNYFLYKNNCYECKMNCKTTRDNCKCDSCERGYFYSNGQCLKYNDSNNKICLDQKRILGTKCSDGYYYSENGECVSCDIGCKTCTGEYECQSCNDGYFSCNKYCCKCNFNCQSTSDNCKCSSCYDGYYMRDYQCYECGYTCKTCRQYPRSCTSCHDGYYLDYSNEQCIKCNDNCKKCFSKDACNTCADNYFIINNECYECNMNFKT